jgi:hypothetical protein
MGDRAAGFTLAGAAAQEAGANAATILHFSIRSHPGRR